MFALGTTLPLMALLGLFGLGFRGAQATLAKMKKLDLHRRQAASLVSCSPD